MIIAMLILGGGLAMCLATLWRLFLDRNTQWPTIFYIIGFIAFLIGCGLEIRREYMEEKYVQPQTIEEPK
jgi:hypothetical protein